MNREEILKIIPKPKNEDVIVYNTELINLIDVDVLKEYYDIFPIYKIKKENYILLKEEIEQYEKSINNIYLYDKSWNELDYLEMLKKEKKTYSTIFSDIKKIENNVQILEKKYKNINEKIEIQRNSDEKKIEDKRKNIDNEIKETKEKILKIENVLEGFKINLKYINEQIQNNLETKAELTEMKQDLEKENCKCIYCGTIIKNRSKNKVSNIIEKKIIKNLSQYEDLQKNKLKIEKEKDYYENELLNLKTTLKNDVEFKKQDYNFYIKKSIGVLKLEAIRDDILNQMLKLKKDYETNPLISSKKYLETKELISKYELSLENLKKIKENKENFKEKYSKIKKLSEELKDLNSKLTLYKKFIEIYYKIYQQKVNDYFGKDFKFVFYKFNNLELIPILELKYKDIEYLELNSFLKKECDNIYVEKISSFY